MGSYVSATVAGGLGGRLLGGWIHQALHWRYAFGIASFLLLSATIAALYLLPREDYSGKTMLLGVLVFDISIGFPQTDGRRTTSTGFTQRRSTRREVLPSMASAIIPCPWEPITTISQSVFSA